MVSIQAVKCRGPDFQWRILSHSLYHIYSIFRKEPSAILTQKEDNLKEEQIKKNTHKHRQKSCVMPSFPTFSTKDCQL